MSDDDHLSELNKLAFEVRQLAEQLGDRFVLAESCTSGLAASVLGQQPGISEYFCGSHVTYRNASKHRWLGVSQTDLASLGPVSETVAIQMATGALTQTPEARWAVSITGHLGPESPAGLDGVVFLGIAVQLDGQVVTTCHQEHLLPASRTERQQLAATVMLRIVHRIQKLFLAVSEVWHGRQKYSIVGSDDICHVLSGAFNPVHAGHLEMAEFVQRSTNHKVHFELSVENVDKPELSEVECIERLLPICITRDLIISRAATFREKVELVGGVCFLVGVDTIVRIAESRYYCDDQDREEVFRDLLDLEVRFLVFGRTMDDSFSTSSGDPLQFTRLEDLSLPEPLKLLCRGVSAEQFRQDFSSRDLR